MNYQENLKKLGLKLPEAKTPVGNYVATKISGKMLFVSGQISIDEKGELIRGKVGKDLDVDSGYNAAKRCALSIISQIMNTCCLLYTSPSPRDAHESRMPSSA